MSQDQESGFADYFRPSGDERDPGAPRPLNFAALLLVTAISLVVGGAMQWWFGSSNWEYAGFVTGVVAVYLVVVEHIWNWPLGIVNVLLYFYVFYDARLYADMSLQLFFCALGFQGWYHWLRGGTGHTHLTISRLRPLGWLLVLAGLAAGTGVYFPIVTHFKGAAPLVDSILTVGSMAAQILLNLKKLETWLLWIAVDVAYIGLYISRDLQSTALLYFIFLMLAMSGLLNWIRLHRDSGALS